MYYTSCRKGQSGNAGFQVWAISNGMTPQEQQELSRRGGYHCPRGLPDTPIAEEMRELFPQAFRFCVLESGRWALIRSTYSGQDYSKRWGNFFAHSLLAESGPLPLWPIDYYEWTGWRDSISDEEDNAEVPPPLELVDLASIPPAESFEFDVLRDFLTAESGRKEMLASMIRAVFLRKQASRSIVIRDTSLNGLFWIACVQKAFPPALAKELSFSTYQYDTRDFATINATVEGSSFLFNDMERKFQFFMFDFVKGQSSDVESQDDDYAAVVVEYMADAPKKLEQFVDFMQAFSYDTLDENLLWPLRLFQARYQPGFSLKADDLAHVLNFVNQYTLPSGWDRVIDALSSTVGAADSLTAQDYESVLTLFLTAAASTRKPEYQTHVCDIWIKLFDESVVAQKAIAMNVIELLKRIRTQLPACEMEIAAKILEPTRQRTISSCIGTLPSEAALTCYRETVMAFNVLKRTPAWQQPQAEEQLMALIQRWDVSLLGRVMALFSNIPEGLMRICDMLLALANSSQTEQQREQMLVLAGRALKQALANQPLEKANKVRELLDRQDRWRLLLNEYRTILESTSESDRQRAYQGYVVQVLPHIPGFAKKEKDTLADHLLSSLPKILQIDQVCRWIDDGTISGRSDYAARWLSLAAQGISLNDTAPAAQKAAEKIAAAAESLGCQLSPNIPFLRKVLTEFSMSSNLHFLLDLPQALNGIDIVDYQAFLADFLPQAVERAQTYEELADIVKSIVLLDHLEVLQTSWEDVWYKQRKNRTAKSIAAEAIYWLSLAKASSSAKGLNKMSTEMLDLLAKGLVKIDNSTFENVCLQVEAKVRRDKLALARWSRIQKDALQRRQSIWSLAKGLFSFKRK
jgi:hypothetical protein